jgi:hypothetical protein
MARRGRVFGAGDAGRKFESVDVAKMNLGALGLQTEIALLDGRVADAVDELAVDRQLDRAVDADDVVDVPLALALAAVLSDLLRVPRGLSGVASSPPAPNSSPCT